MVRFQQYLLFTLLFMQIAATDTTGQIPVSAYEPVSNFFRAKTIFRNALTGSKRNHDNVHVNLSTQ